MGRLPRKNTNTAQSLRDRVLKLRLTQDEYDRLVCDTQSHGYNVVSRYVRDVLFAKPVRVSRSHANTDGERIRQLQQFVSLFRNIGGNYNQFVKEYSSAVQRTRKNGDPVVNTAFTDLNIRKLSASTDNLIQVAREIKKILQDET